MRTCDVCKNEFQEGYCIGDGESYYCSDECLHTVITPEEYDELYEEEAAYWSSWNEPEPMRRIFASAYADDDKKNEVITLYAVKDEEGMLSIWTDEGRLEESPDFDDMEAIENYCRATWGAWETFEFIDSDGSSYE